MQLMEAMREYVQDQSLAPIERTVHELREDFGDEEWVVNHIQLALLKFQVGPSSPVASCLVHGASE